MSEDVLSMAAKLDILRNALPRGLAAGYDSAGEKTRADIQPAEFAPFRSETTIADSGSVTSPLEPPFIPQQSNGGGGGPCVGPFGVVFQAGTDWKLLGGTVTGGGGTETFGSLVIGTIGSEPADGTFYWLVVGYLAIVEDDVLLPGGDITSASLSNGATVPDNVIPTYATPTGTLYISLGQWQNDVFYPSACGDINVNHCPGSLSYSRI